MGRPLLRGFGKEVRQQLKVVRLNNQTIQKRKISYVKAGVYSVSCQIFLTDLLRGSIVINPRSISKVIVKLTERVRNYYHYYAWLTTFLKIYEQKHESRHQIPLIFVCNMPSYYAFEEDLKEIYRIFFCHKVVIWPFGRAEIHKKLNHFRQNKRIKEWEHGLSHSQSERTIQ